MSPSDIPVSPPASDELTQAGRSLFSRWVRASAVGWMLGVLLVLVLAVLWDMLGGGAQFMGGVGMGAGVGLLQARLLKSRVASPRRWWWASTLGMGFPFLLWDLGAAAGFGSGFSLPRCVLLGSLLVGFLQHRLLAAQFAGAAWWIPASVVGWGLPAGAIALEDAGFMPRPFNLILTILFGGVVLGAVTGAVLLRLRRRSEAGPGPAARTPS